VISSHLQNHFGYFSNTWETNRTMQHHIKRKVLLLFCFVTGIRCEQEFANNNSLFSEQEFANSGNIWAAFGNFFQSFMDWFGSGSWTPWVPSPGVALELVDINNQSAILNCSWTSPVSGNITWQVDNESAESDEDTAGGSTITINWEDFDKEPGDIVAITCIGESSGNNGTWAGMSQVMESFMVPGGENMFENFMNFTFTDYP